MASVQTSKYDGRYLKLTVTEASTSIENNTSTLNWVLESIGGNSNYYNIYDCKVTINGEVVYGPVTKTWDSYVFPAKKGSTSGTVTVTHNADGTAPNVSFTLRGSVFNNSPQNYSDSIPLTTIPRASSITVLDANIGSSTNITINKASSNFTTTIYYKASGQSSWTKIVDKTSNQVYGWTVPTSFYSLIQNSKTIQCQFYAETYLDGSYVGTSPTITSTFTATGVPTINSVTAVDTNSTTTNLTGNSSNMVRYASNVKITVSASGVNSANISSIKVNGTTASSGVVTFNSCNTNSFEIVVTDTRGYTRTQTKTMTMVNYVPLTINADIKRNTPTDGKVNIQFNGNYFNGSFGSQSNTLTVQYRYKVSTSSSWGSWTTVSNSKSGNTYSGSTQLSSMDYTNSYNFEIRATDKIGTKTITGITVTKGQPVYWWDSSALHTNKLKISNGGSLGIYNANDMPIISDHNNQNVTVDATGATLFLGYRNTTGINFLNGKGNIASSGLLTMNNTILANGGYLKSILSGRTNQIGSQNSSYCHYITDAPYGHWFNTDVRVQGNIYGGSSYNKLVAYNEQLPQYGTSGIWKYIKYDNGYAICVGQQNISTGIGNSWGNIYSSGDKDLTNFPFTFTEVPYVMVGPHAYSTNPGGGGYSCFVAGGNASATTTNPGKVLLLRGAKESTARNYRVTIFAFGKWK